MTRSTVPGGLARTNVRTLAEAITGTASGFWHLWTRPAGPTNDGRQRDHPGYDPESDDYDPEPVLFYHQGAAAVVLRVAGSLVGGWIIWGHPSAGEELTSYEVGRELDRWGGNEIWPLRLEAAMRVGLLWLRRRTLEENLRQAEGCLEQIRARESEMDPRDFRADLREADERVREAADALEDAIRECRLLFDLHRIRGHE